MAVADEGQGARMNGLRPWGTISILFDAVRDGILTFEEFLALLERLLDAGFYFDVAVYLEASQEVRQTAEKDGGS